MPPKAPYSGTVRGTLVKQNTSHGGSEYARKVYCVLTGYTLWEYDGGNSSIISTKEIVLEAGHTYMVAPMIADNNDALFDSGIVFGKL